MEGNRGKQEPEEEPIRLLADHTRQEEVERLLENVAERELGSRRLPDVQQERGGFIAFATDLERRLEDEGVEEAATYVTELQVQRRIKTTGIDGGALLRTKAVIRQTLEAYQNALKEEEKGVMQLTGPDGEELLQVAHPLDVGFAVGNLGIEDPFTEEILRSAGNMHDLEEETTRSVRELLAKAAEEHPFPSKRMAKEYIRRGDQIVMLETRRNGFIYVEEYQGIMVTRVREGQRIKVQDRFAAGTLKALDRLRLTPTANAFRKWNRRMREYLKTDYIAAGITLPILKRVLPRDDPFRVPMSRATYSALLTLYMALGEWREEKERELAESGERERITQIRSGLDTYIREGGFEHVTPSVHGDVSAENPKVHDGTIVNSFLLLFPTEQKLQKRIRQDKLNEQQINKILKRFIRGNMEFIQSDEYRAGRRSATQEYKRCTGERELFIDRHEKGEKAVEYQLASIDAWQRFVARQILNPGYDLFEERRMR